MNQKKSLMQAYKLYVPGTLYHCTNINQQYQFISSVYFKFIEVLDEYYTHYACQILYIHRSLVGFVK